MMIVKQMPNSLKKKKNKKPLAWSLEEQIKM